MGALIYLLIFLSKKGTIVDYKPMYAMERPLLDKYSHSSYLQQANNKKKVSHKNR